MSASLIKSFPINTVGRDFAVGDIHGHFSRLQQALDAAGFNPDTDRLFSVGDLVDRGPECRSAIDWLAKPWFHPVRGNHDDYVVRFDTCDVDNWVYNGGAWFAGLAWDEQREFAAQFAELPIAIEVETPGGLIGLVHADCPFPSWFQLQFALTGALSSKELKLVKNTCMWSRSRIEQEDTSGVLDVHAMVVGHTPLHRPAVLGNVHYIDTMGWSPQDGGYFTLLDLNSLRAIPEMPTELHHPEANPKRTRKLWTPEEDRALRELAPIQSYAAIGEALCRSRSAVHARAKALGIKCGLKRGENHHMAKLTNLQAAMLGTLLDAGFTAKEIKAALPNLPVTAHSIGDIGRGNTWGRVHH